MITYKELPMLIIKALAHGCTIYPYQLPYVLKSYYLYTIPDDVLNTQVKDFLDDYIKALYLSAQESAGDWSVGHKMLEELGFVKKERTEGHRSFVKLVWENSNETTH